MILHKIAMFVSDLWNACRPWVIACILWAMLLAVLHIFHKVDKKKGEERGIYVGDNLWNGAKLLVIVFLVLSMAAVALAHYFS